MQLLQDLVLVELTGKPLLVKDRLEAACTVLDLREVEQDLVRATKSYMQGEHDLSSML